MSQSLYASYDTAKKLYDEFHITEWREKSMFYTIEEQANIIADLEMGRDSATITMIRLPYPHFVEEFLKCFQTSDFLLHDPTIGYKLYFQDSATIQGLVYQLKNPDISLNKLFEDNHLHRQQKTHSILARITDIPFEDFVKSYSATTKNDNRQAHRKYAYLTQYIDLKEARRLNLRIANTFKRDGVDGYDFESKLAILNPVLKRILTLYLGLYGERRHNLKEIHREIGMTDWHIDDLITMLMPLFTKSLGEFKNAIGYYDEDQEPNCHFQYRSPRFRQGDISISTNYIYINLSDTDKEVLKKCTQKERKCYIAAKYMFKTPKSLAKNLGLSISEAGRRLALI